MRSLQSALNQRFCLPACPSDRSPQLTPQQLQTLAASLMIMQTHRAVLLCEATGTGKTYVACALAQSIQTTGHLTCVIVAPAHLIPQWRDVTQTFQLHCHFYSYQAASIGKIPEPSTETLWIIDEAHYLKNPATQRYRALHSLTFAHRICLITATPVSMGFRDLYALSMLCGFPNHTSQPDPTVIRAFALAIMPQSYVPPLTIDAAPGRIQSNLPYTITPDAHKLTQLIDEISAITWIAADENGTCIHTDIVAQILMHRLVSHRYACLQTLRRIARYYKQHHHTPQLLSRTQFRNLFGLEGNQQLLPFTDFAYGTRLDEQNQKVLKSASSHIQRAQNLLESICQTADGKLESIRNELLKSAPDQRIVLFTQYADTAHYYAKHLNLGIPVAVVTAQGAWYNHHQISAEIVMDMFNPDKALPKWWEQAGFAQARIMICTDALACGHNFHRANTIIHLDYPWNPTTLHQREGRILRRGQSAAQIHTICTKLRYAPPQILAYESELIRRLSVRQSLQTTWIHQTHVDADEFILVNNPNIPGLWARTGNLFFPVAPSCLPDTNHVHLELTDITSVFLPSVRSPQNQHLWQIAKKQRHHPQTCKTIRQFIANLIESTILPKHFAQSHPPNTSPHPLESHTFTYDTLVHQNNSKSIPIASLLIESQTSCIRIQTYPHPHILSTQQTHNLSTGTGAFLAADSVQNRVKTENSNSR